MRICHIPILDRENFSPNVEKVLKQIRYCSCDNGADSKIITYNIKLALWELFSNFICHGTEVSCKDICITINETDVEIILQVTSIGNEFDWGIYKDIECPSVYEARGRGLFILQQICHSFSYEQNGQVARMIFKKGEEVTC